MTASEMADVLFTRVGPGGTELSNDDANYLRALLRRDWAVRVLDAAKLHLGLSADEYMGVKDGADMPELLLQVPNGGTWKRHSLHHGTTFDAARLAAALAVFHTLSDEKRAELGEGP